MAVTRAEMDQIDDDLECIIDKEQIDIYKKNNTIELDNESNPYINGDALINLFVSLTPEKQEYLLSKIISNNSTDWFTLIFYFSLKLGKIDLFLSYFKDTHFSFSMQDIFFLRGFTDIAKYINNKQMNQLKNIIMSARYNDRFTPIIDEIYGLIVGLRFDRFSSQLQGVNIEINRDRVELIKIIEYLGFDKKYDQFLTELDVHFLGDKDPIQTAGFISSFRQFSSDLIIDIAQKIAEIEGLEEIPPAPNADATTQAIGHARHYIKEKLELSDDEDKLLKYFVKILHENGGHAFLSSMQYFRLAKNIFIEIMLFLISRYRDFQAKSAE